MKTYWKIVDALYALAMLGVGVVLVLVATA